MSLRESLTKDVVPVHEESELIEEANKYLNNAVCINGPWMDWNNESKMVNKMFNEKTI